MSTGPTRLSRCCASACERSPRLELCRWSHSRCQTLVGALYSCKPTISWISSSWRFFETLPKMSCCGVSVANEISRPPAEKARGWEGVEVGAHQQPLHRIYFRNLFLLADMEFVKNFTPSDFLAKNFTPSISPNFYSFSKKKHRKWENLFQFITNNLVWTFI